MIKHLITLFLSILLYGPIAAQCECTDCPINIPNNATVSSFMDISGATNGTLGAGGQQLCMICISLVYDAVQELGMVLISPSGDEVELMVNTGVGVNDNITFEICFVSCDQSADPDSGFPEVFDTDAGYLPNETYDGSYYPAVACLEELSGDVNGEWELEMTDNVFLDNGDLLDWYMVFTDDSGLGCANASECSNSVTCEANGGELDGADPIIACEGDAALDLDIPVSYPNGGEPPAGEYDYTYVILELPDLIVEDINMTTDLSSYESGTYQICGLSYLTADAAELPSADGVLSYDDIEDQIDDGDYCADFSDNCITIEIDPVVDPPDFVGPTDVCVDELAIYEILDYDPSITYAVAINSGGVSQFINLGQTLEIIWIIGPGQICVTAQSICGDETTCLDINVGDVDVEYEVNGELNPCPGAIEIYDIIPGPPAGTSYLYSAVGGTIINQTDNSFEVEWQNSESSGEICVELIGSVCASEIVCETVSIELPYTLPAGFDAPTVLCNDQEGTASIDDDIEILNYIWTVTNGLSIISGQGTSEITVSGSSIGLTNLCLEIETSCGLQGPVCEEIEILETPDPEILDPDLDCELELSLEGITSPENTLEWVTVSGPDEVEFNPTDDNITEAVFPITGQYEIGLIESNEACSTTEIIVVELSGELILSDEMFVCDLDNFYTVGFEILSGNPPYSVNGIEISGNIFTSESILSSESYSFSITDSQGCGIILEDSYDCPCFTEAGNMNDELLIACLSNGETIQADWLNDGALDNNDIGLYFLHDNDGDELGFIFDFNETGEFVYTTDLIPGEIYYISYVAGDADGNEIDLDDPCLSIAPGQPVQFLENPDLDFVFNINPCDLSVVIEAEQGNLNVSAMTQISGPSDSEISFDGQFPFTINITSPGNYQFSYLLANEACEVTKEFSINIPTPLDVTLIQEDCGGGSDFYTISFTLIGGQSPYFSSIAGTFTDSLFVSDPIASGTEYNIFFTDSNGCSSEELTGQKKCDCISDAGILSTDTLRVCGSTDSISITSPLNTALDTNDIALFYLHKSSDFIYSERIDSSLNGIFGFIQDSMFLDTTYYVSFLVGNNGGTGLDMTDLCLDVSNSQAVVWQSTPTANAGDDSFSCDEEFTMSASPATGQWSIVNVPDLSSIEISDNNNAEATITLKETGNYMLAWSTTVNSCSSSDTVTVTKVANPEISAINTSCNEDLISYDLQLEFADNANYFINGINYTGFYNQNNIASDSSLDLVVSSEFGCETTISIDPIDCSCSSAIGSLSELNIELCVGENPDLSLFNNDFIQGENDSLFYILHDGSGQNIGNIIQSSADSILFFDAIVPGEVYTINMVITADLDGAVDFTAPCTLVSEGLSVVWLSENFVEVPTDISDCLGSELELNFAVSQYLPVSLLLISDQNDSLEVELTDNDQVVLFPTSNNISTIEVEYVSGVCVMPFNTLIQLDLVEPIVPEFQSDIVICNNAVFGSELELDNLFVDDLIGGTWDAGSLAIDDNKINFDGLTAGSYNLIFSTVGFEDPCPGNSYNINISVTDCVCPELSFDDIDICKSERIYDLSQVDTGVYSGNWSIESVDNATAIPFIDSGNLLNFESADPGRYFLLYTIADTQFPEPCNNIFEFELILFPQPEAGQQAVFTELCITDEVELFLFDLIENEDPGGQWFYKDTPLEAEFNTNILDLGLNTLNYIVPPSGICPGDTASIEIELYPGLDFSLETENVICFGENNGSISIVLESGASDAIQCYLNDILQSGSKTIEGLSPGSYEIYLENDYCRSEIQLVEIFEPEPVSISLGEDRLVNIEEEVIITAITNILQSDLEEISWSDLSGILQLDLLELRKTFNSNDEIIVEITDENGCIAVDKIKIIVLQPELYVPNIFSLSSLDNNRFGIGNPEAVESINSFYIFDRWGNKIVDQINPDPFSSEAQWDGYYNNEKVEIGVYLYFFDLVLKTGESLVLRGDLTLVR